MESLMSGAMLIEVTLLSFLLALWVTWLGLSGLFRLLPASNRNASPLRFVANRQAGNINRHAA
jgi:hypothetical protein